MEVSFVFSAARRFWWVIVACMVLVTGGLLSLTLPGGDQYESTALLLVSPPSDSGYVSSQSDRYVINEIEVLRSNVLSTAVAEQVGGLSPATVRGAIVIAQTPASDIVSITATASSPQIAQAIAQAYATLYLESLELQVNGEQDARLQLLQTRLTDLGAEIDTLNAQIEDVMAPYVEAAADGDGQVPQLSDVNPGLDSRRVQLQNEYASLNDAATDAELGRRVEVTSQLVQPADLNTTPIPTSLIKYVLAGVVGGAFVGLSLAVFLGRTSRSVLDEAHADEIMGGSLVGTHPTLDGVETVLFGIGVRHMPAEVRKFIDTLCARAESLGVPGRPLTIAVVGAEAGAGATTLARNMANGFAIGGRQVLLVDGDSNNTEITELFAVGAPSLAAIVSGDPRRDPKDNVRALPGTVRTSVAGLRVAGLASEADVRALQNNSADVVLDAASRLAEIVVVDCGPLLSLASTMRLVRAADVVILAIPTKHLPVGTLRSAASQLATSGGNVLAVRVPARPLNGNPVRTYAPDGTKSTTAVAG